MTRFWREGFHRTNSYGTTSWVEGHWVERNDWSRYGNYGSPGEYYRLILRKARADRITSARFVEPNAECPVCGADVFFYQNEQGSRVFFDELGPPWPKHPCTDATAGNLIAVSDFSPRSLAPVAREDDDISTIQDSIDALRIDPIGEFASSYGMKPWLSVRVIKRIKGAGGVFLIMRNLDPGTSQKNWFLCSQSLPRHLKDGSVVSVRRQVMSYFDIASMTPKERVFRRIKSASLFINEIAGSDTLVP